MPKSHMLQFMEGKLEQAIKLFIDGEDDKAEQIFNSLLNRQIDDPALIYYLGCCALKKGNNGLASQLFIRAVEMRPEFPEAWHNLAAAYRTEQFIERAEKCILRAISLNPNHADFWNTLGTLYVNDGNPDECIKACDKALELDPENHHAHHNRGLAYLEKGDWKRGWEGFAWRFQSDAVLRTNHWYNSDVPRWEGQKGKRVVVYGEQGLGDEIMFSTCLPEIIRDSKEVALDLNPRLDPLYIRSFPEVLIDPEREEAQARRGTIDWAKDFKPEYRIPVADLAIHYRKQDSDFPTGHITLKPDPDRVAHYKSLFDGRFTVAFSWMGGIRKTRVELRSLHPNLMKPLMKIPNTRFISFQYHNWAAKEAEIQGFEHWEDPAKDMDEQAAFLSAVDLVISPCQTGIHLSGALGVPCWVLTPAKPAWRYGLKGEKMAWYDSIKMYRQTKDDDWKPVIKRVKRDLQALVNRKAKAA